MRQMLARTLLWIPLIPTAVFSLGILCNQATEIANGGKFPVMANSVKAREFDVQKDGMMDDTHVLMDKGSHLKALADIIDLDPYGTFSIGDGFLYAAAYTWDYFLVAWLALILKKLYSSP